MVEKIVIDDEITQNESTLLSTLLEIIEVNPLCEDCSTIMVNGLQKKAFLDADVLKKYYTKNLQNVCDEIKNLGTTFSNMDSKQASFVEG